MEQESWFESWPVVLALLIALIGGYVLASSYADCISHNAIEQCEE